MIFPRTLLLIGFCVLVLSSVGQGVTAFDVSDDALPDMGVVKGWSEVDDTLWTDKSFRIFRQDGITVVAHALKKDRWALYEIDLFSDAEYENLDTCFLMDVDGTGLRELILITSAGGQGTSGSYEEMKFIVINRQEFQYMLRFDFHVSETNWTPYEDRFDDEGNMREENFESWGSYHHVDLTAHEGYLTVDNVEGEIDHDGPFDPSAFPIPGRYRFDGKQFVHESVKP